MNSDAQLLEKLADEFEAAWQSDSPPSLAEFLRRVTPEQRLPLARHLIPIDIEYGRIYGESVQSEQYQELGIDCEKIAADWFRGNTALEGLPRSSLNSSQPPGPNAESPDGTMALPEGQDDQTLKTPLPDARSGDQPSVPEPMIVQQSTASQDNKMVGPYRLLQRLGKGGMGEVWMAEQTVPVKRRVALKLIKEGLGSKEIIARFEAERQALALMNHPNIARILDAGTTDKGQPYFVMELVLGKPLTTYCDENRLSIDERLKLFMDVCAGVQHAHQKGIIHRDLKPGNIIVGTQDGMPVPKVIDFGLAKAMENAQRLTDQSLFTGIGQILGTLKYMSPEQASLDNLDIDTRADIYALGVVLYELLTGSTPLEDSSIKGQAALKILEIIRDKEPVKPSSRLSSSTDQEVSAVTGQRRTDSVRLKRVLLGDLDWIVMKALEKDRTRRYETASSFATDIGRYLSSEPVVARPPSLNYRFRKFAKKNRGFVFSSAAVLVSILAGLIGIIWFAADAYRARRLAEKEAQRAIENEKTANRHLEQALNAVDDFFLIVSEEKLAQKPGLQDLRIEMLSKATTYYETLLADQHGANEQTTEQLIRKLDAQIRYARMLNALGDFDQAESTLDAALIDSQRIQIDQNAAENHLVTIARVYDIYASTRVRQGHLEDAEEACRKGIEQILTWHAFNPSAPQLGIHIDLLITSAEISRRQGRLADARDKLMSAKEIVAAPNLSDRRGDELDSLAEVLVQLSDLATQAEAIDLLQESVDIRQKQLKQAPDDLRNRLVLGKTLTSLAWRIRGQDPEKAISIFKEAESHISILQEENPSVVSYSDALCQTLDLMAYTKHQYGAPLDDLERRQGLLEQALEHYRKAEQILTSSGKDVGGAPNLSELAKHQQVLLVMIFNGQALVWRDLGDLDNSLENFEKAFALQKLIAIRSPNEVRSYQDMAGTQHNMGRTLMKFGKIKEALEQFMRAVSILKEMRERFPEADYLAFDLANSQFEVNSALIKQGDLDQLRLHFEPTAALWRQAEVVKGRAFSLALVVEEIAGHIIENLDSDELSLEHLLSTIDKQPTLEAASLMNAYKRVSELIELLSQAEAADSVKSQVLRQFGNEIVERLRTEHGFEDQQLPKPFHPE